MFLYIAFRRHGLDIGASDLIVSIWTHRIMTIGWCDQINLMYDNLS